MGPVWGRIRLFGRLSGHRTSLVAREQQESILRLSLNSYKYDATSARLQLQSTSRRTAPKQCRLRPSKLEERFQGLKVAFDCCASNDTSLSAFRRHAPVARATHCEFLQCN